MTNSIEGVSVEIDPCHLTKSDGPCDGFRVSVFVNDNLIGQGMAATVAEAVRWCMHNIRRQAERAHGALARMGFQDLDKTPQRPFDKEKT